MHLWAGGLPAQWLTDGERPGKRGRETNRVRKQKLDGDRERDCPRLRPKEVEQILETHCQPRPPKWGYSLQEVRLESVSKKYERWWTDTLKLSVHVFQNVLRKVRFERTIKEENAWRKNKSLNWLEKKSSFKNNFIWAIVLIKEKQTCQDLKWLKVFERGKKKRSTRKCFSDVAQ